MRTILTLLIICFTFLVNAQTDVNSNDEFITIKVKIDKSFAEHGQKEYFIVKTEEVCDDKRKNNSTVRFGNYSSIQQSYSQSKNNGFNFNKTYNYGSYKKSNKCFSKKKNKFYHNHHEIETNNIHNTRLFEFISEEGDTIILNEESNDHIFIANDLHFTDKKNMQFIRDDGKTIKIMFKTE